MIVISNHHFNGEIYATPEQEQAIATLNGEVVVHRFLNERANMALIGTRGTYGSPGKPLWIDPLGITHEAQAPHFCSGNPTLAHCVAAGYCRRNRACNE